MLNAPYDAANASTDKTLEVQISAHAGEHDI